jgi:hypothetical protein
MPVSTFTTLPVEKRIETNRTVSGEEEQGFYKENSGYNYRHCGLTELLFRG